MITCTIQLIIVIHLHYPGTRSAFSDSGVDSAYHCMPQEFTHPTDAYDTSLVDHYAPSSVGPPGYEPPYSVGGAYNHDARAYNHEGGAYDAMGVAYSSNGGEYEQIGSSTYGGGTYAASDTPTPSLPRLGVAMASIHRKREHGYSVNNQNNPGSAAHSSYSRHQSTNSGLY